MKVKDFTKLLNARFLICFGILIFILFSSNIDSGKISEKKYITSSFEEPSDLGNMLFRFASLYGIGKRLGRTPYVNGSINLQLKGLTEISEYFPLLHDVIEIKVPSQSLVKSVNFSDHCCTFTNPKNLQKYKNETFLKVSANYLQSYKYFHQHKSDIMNVMECSDSFKKRADEIATEIWKNEKSSHKMCIHIRRGDFVANWPLESRMDFSLPATKYILKDLKSQKNIKNISLMVLGNDKQFIQNFSALKLNTTFINNLISFNTSRSFDMCFGIRFCDSLLISASSSTYAWWIGYLMKSQGPVYYNAIITKIGIHVKDIHDFDLFPPHWKKLLLQDGRLKEETKWTIERRGFKVPPDDQR